MARRIIDISRRQVLKGACGTIVGLPLLPSLLTKSAYGADPVFTRRPRIYWVTTEHGGAFESSMFPAQSLLTSSTALFSDHTIRSGTLQATSQGTDTVLSAVLRAPSNELTPALVSKMNVLHGLDVPFYIAHNTGLHLGNYARNDGNGNDGKAVQSSPRPTIDQIMAWSPSFYPDLTNIRERALVMDDRPVSWNYSDPSNPSASSKINNVSGYTSSLSLFNKIFVTPTTGGPAPRTPIVDRVLGSYRRLRNGNTRLSASDRQRLDDHIARIAELQRKLTAGSGGGSAAACSATIKPTDDANKHNGNSPAEATRQLELYNEVAAVAFMCGTSRIAVLAYGDTSRFVSYGGDWHQEVAHQWQLADKQAQLVQSYQRFFSTVLLDMATRLTAEEAPGVSYLDNSLLVWTQESGMETHGSVSIPVITFGSAAGALKTGLFCDYRRMGNRNSEFDPGAGGKQTLGLLYNQWLATALQAMRVPPSEFERWGHKGYGVPYLTKESWTPPYAKHYGDTNSRYFTMASDWLPFLKA
jgi:hypothetical protein